MRFLFTEEQEKLKVNVVFVEDICFSARILEGEGKNFKMNGRAVIENEVYDDFTIEFSTIEDTDGLDAGQIMNLEWDEYDFVF